MKVEIRRGYGNESSLLFFHGFSLPLPLPVFCRGFGMMLEARRLTCGYEDGFFLQDVDLAVAPGECLGIIGPNGSGKTTLVRALARSLKPLAGEVLLEGRDVWSIPPREFARRVAVVSQDAQVGYMRVEEYVLLGRIPHYRPFQFLETSRDLEVADTAMELTGINYLKGRLLGEMSGGERQLVMLARALAQEPRLLILDEPTAHLDMAHQVAVLDLVRRLKEELGIALVVVLHDLNLASEYSDGLLLMKGGRVKKMGAPHEVIREDLLGEVYGVEVVVQEHPVSRRPHVMVISGRTEVGSWRK